MDAAKLPSVLDALKPLVEDGSRAVQQYNPDQGLKRIAVAQTTEKVLRDALRNDPEDPFLRQQLGKVIDVKIEEQADYSVWRYGAAGHGGDRKSKSRSKNNDLDPLPAYDPGDDRAYRWRKKYCRKAGKTWVRDEDKIKLAKKDATHRATRICEAQPDGTVRGAEGTGEIERYTPAEYVEKVREVLGEIDLDPATCELAQQTVRATRYFTLVDDGLKQEWHGNVFLNPPYHHLCPIFINKLIEELKAGRTTAAILLVNNCTDTEWFDVAIRDCASVCFKRGRISFIDENGQTMGVPPQGQIFLFYGPDVDRFEDVFSSIGNCFPPPRRIYQPPITGSGRAEYDAQDDGGWRRDDGGAA